jgi:small subunit ribosomal protein S14
MAKTSMVNREQRRRELVEKYRTRRTALRVRVVDPALPDEDRWAAMLALQKLPRDSMRARRRNRCGLTGRSRGYYRKFGLSRMKLREVVMRGDAPGVVKASW